MTQTAGESADVAEQSEVGELPLRQSLNSLKLIEHVIVVCDHRDLSLRKAASEMGVPHDSLVRMRQGMVPGGGVVLAILAWLHAEPTAYLQPRTERPARKSA